MCRNAHRQGQVLWPGLAHRHKHFQRITQTVGQGAAVVVGTLIGQWADETGQQIAVRTMQLEPVKASLCGALGRRHKLGRDFVHVSPRHGARHSTMRQIWQRRSGQQGPVAFGIIVGHRLVHARTLPRAAAGAFGPRVANLQTDLGVALAVHPIVDALEVGGLLVVPQTRATVRDAPIGTGRRHLHHHQPRAAHGPSAQVHQVVVPHAAIGGFVLRHGRNHHTVFEGDRALGIGREHGWPQKLFARRFLCATCEPGFITLQPSLVAQTQIFVADALTAGEHGVHELLRLQLVAIAFATHLEPLHRIPCGVLQANDINLAHSLVVLQHVWNAIGRVAQGLELAHQLDGIFKRELGA